MLLFLELVSTRNLRLHKKGWIFLLVLCVIFCQELTYRESLFCIQTAFTLLTGVGASLNIDPLRFYTHLYKTLFDLHSGTRCLNNLHFPKDSNCIQQNWNTFVWRFLVNQLVVILQLGLWNSLPLGLGSILVNIVHTGRHHRWDKAKTLQMVWAPRVLKQRGLGFCL